MYHHIAIIGPRWTERFLDLAAEVATWSRDPSLKCGAVVVNSRRRVVGLGYNGFPDKIEDKQEWLNDRDEKYPMIIHAEVNAVLNATASVEGCSLFVTAMPCHDCAKFIVQAGIAEVHYRDHTTGPQAEYLVRWADRVAIAKKVFDRAGVPMIATPVLAQPDDDPFADVKDAWERAQSLGLVEGAFDEVLGEIAKEGARPPLLNMDEVDCGLALGTPEYLRGLAETLFLIPTLHGIDQGDYDRLHATANYLEGLMG